MILTGANQIPFPFLCNLTFKFNHRLFGGKSPFSGMNCPYYTTRTDRNQHFFAIFPFKNATLALCTNFCVLNINNLSKPNNKLFHSRDLCHFLPIFPGFSPENGFSHLACFLQNSLHLPFLSADSLHLFAQCVHFCNAHVLCL